MLICDLENLPPKKHQNEYGKSKYSIKPHNSFRTYAYA